MTTTNQSIGGFKTFTNIISGNITGNAATATTSTNASLIMDNSTNQSHRLTFLLMVPEIYHLKMMMD